MAAKSMTGNGRRTANFILAAIKDEPLDEQGIVSATGYSTTTVRTYISLLRKAGEVHVAGWGPKIGLARHPRMFLAGPGEDKPYPLAQQYVSCDYGVATERELEAAEEWKPKRKCDHPVLIARDWAVAAFFGEYQGVGA